MLNWFKFRSIDSRDMGLHCSSMPAITVPNQRTEFKTVRGRSGSVVMLQGADIYDDMTLAVECVLTDRSLLQNVAAWLRGSGEVEFANRAGGCYDATVVNQLELTRVIPAADDLRFTVTFRCQPGWRHNDAQPITLNASGSTVTNPGTLPSCPRLKITGSGDVTLHLGSSIVYLVGMTGGGIIIDTELGDALTFDGALLANEHMEGALPRLQPGANVVTWEAENGSGTITKLEITPRWMSL